MNGKIYRKLILIGTLMPGLPYIPGPGEPEKSSHF